jgi:Amt family ammonium transporter
MGFHDFAGSGVVHATGGFSALVGAILLGPRIGKYQPDGTPRFIGGHNIPLVSLGAFVLWFGWFGFNPGSALTLSDPSAVALIAMNTNMAAAAGAVAMMVAAWLRFGKPDLALTLNGALAGLVAITASCSVVTPGSAIYIGLIAGVLCLYGVVWLDKWQIDDPVGAFPVHGLNGVWGVLAVGLWGQNVAVGKAKLSGLFYGGGFKLVLNQLMGMLAIILFVTAAMWIIFKSIDVLIGLRVSQTHELGGLDINEHGMESYSGFQIYLTE